MHTNPKPDQGFTLTELMVTLAVLVTLFTLGVPSMTTTIRNNQLITQSDRLFDALDFARTEAVKRRSHVVICKSSDGASCAETGSWTQGWVLFEDTNSNATVDETEGVLRSNTDFAGTDVQIEASTAIADFVAFQSTGSARKPDGTAQSGLLVMCDERGFGDYARAVRLLQTGQVRLAKASDAGAASCTP